MEIAERRVSYSAAHQLELHGRIPESFIRFREMKWRDATQMELDSFLRTYPNPLDAQPPIERKARYREWCDAMFGDWPDNVVAKCWARGRCTGFQIRVLQDQISDS
jgi:hypothetical protein